MESKKTGQILIMPDTCVGVGQDQTALEAMLGNKVDINHSCGGHGTCGTCRIVILSGLELLESRGEIEQEMADARGFLEHERLACQIHVPGTITIKIP